MSPATQNATSDQKIRTWQGATITPGQLFEKVNWMPSNVWTWKIPKLLWNCKLLAAWDESREMKGLLDISTTGLFEIHDASVSFGLKNVRGNPCSAASEIDEIGNPLRPSVL